MPFFSFRNRNFLRRIGLGILILLLILVLVAVGVFIYLQRFLVYGKDGVYPTDGYRLGEEVRLGDGRVNYPALVRGLHEAGFTGDITIEREINGEEQRRDILHAKQLLDDLIANL